MFKKRLKKNYPPGTFIPTKARICCILQLCLAFTLILWYASLPFVGEIFRLKSELLHYQEVMGIASNDKLPVERLEHLKRNQKRFEELPMGLQMELKEAVREIQMQFGRPFYEKVIESLHIFKNELSPFEFAWLILSVVIPIMLLKKVEGARQVVWLLPLLTVCYALDNHWYSKSSPPSIEKMLFPPEKKLIDKYFKEPINDNPMIQMDQFRNAWHQYLVEEWGEENAIDSTKGFPERAEKAEYLFSLTKVELMTHREPELSRREKQQPLVLLALYLFWNCYMAYATSFYTDGFLSSKSASRKIFSNASGENR